MAQSFTSYVVENDKEFQAAVLTAIDEIGDLSLPFNSILKDFYRSEQAIFKLGGPGQYPDISEKYAKQKEKAVGFRYPLLLRSGSLAASLLSANAAGSIADITKTSLSFGTSIPYGIYHQSDDPRSKIPLRKFLFIGPEASEFANSDQMGRLTRWKGYVSDYVVAKIRLNQVAT